MKLTAGSTGREATVCYKQVKQELGWADFMVRSDRAIRRHSRAGVLRLYLLLVVAQSAA
jgi:hypothetical protein